MTTGTHQREPVEGVFQTESSARIGPPRADETQPTLPRTQASATVLAPSVRVAWPTGLLSDLTSRRVMFGSLVAATVMLLAVWLARILAADGFSLLDALLLLAFIVEAPWSVHNAWNGVIGFLLARGFRRPTEIVFPPAARTRDGDAVFARTAVLMTLRNEDCARAFARMRTVKESIEATGYGDRFEYFLLSDSNHPEVIAAEEAAIAEWRAEDAAPHCLHYRRREANVGFKAGNVYDFCERWGERFDFMLPLDADSLMTGETILRLVRTMQANPSLGILQSLISGTPSRSFFERLLHFGPRPGARLFILGSSWWQGDSGPFWGHNAVIRIRPFTEHCRLPLLKGKPPLGGYILSHDQVEAVCMRRGGYEVRVLPEEQGSYEDNPPTLLDYLRRHLRWCQGNLQYLKLRHHPGMLQPKATHFYLWLAIELFFSMAGMTAFVVLAAIAAASRSAEIAFPAASAVALFGTWLTIYFLPKIIGTLDAFVYEARRYGGRVRLLVGTAIETCCSVLLTPIANLTSTIFMIGLLFGRKVVWDAQRRDGYRLPWRTAARALWPQTFFGLAVLTYLMHSAPGAVVWFLPFLAGPIAAIPFAVLTSSPLLGHLSAQWNVLALPEEIDTPWELAEVTPWLEASPTLQVGAADLRIAAE